MADFDHLFGYRPTVTKIFMPSLLMTQFRSFLIRSRASSWWIDLVSITKPAILDRIGSANPIELVHVWRKRFHFSHFKPLSATF